MSQSGQNGYIVFGPQAAKGSAASTFYKYRATDIDYGALSPGGVLPPEIASIMVPTGAYKSGIFAGGGFSMIPRLENDIGWLLYALMGNVASEDAHIQEVCAWSTLADSATSTPSIVDGGPWTTAKTISVQGSAAGITGNVELVGTDSSDDAATDTIALSGTTLVTGTTEFKTVTSVTLPARTASGDQVAVGWTTGAYKHVFKFASDVSSLPWLNIGKKIPGDSTQMYTDVLDNRLASGEFTIPQAGPVAARFAAVGRNPSFPESPTWSVDGMDSGSSFPISNATGFFKMPGWSASSVGVAGMMFGFANGLTSPQEEMVVGSYYPEDFGVRSRQAVVRFAMKWSDPALYRHILTGADSGSESFTPEVFTTSVQASVSTPANISSSVAEPYRLQFDMANVNFAPNGAPRLAGNQTIAVEYVGTALEPTSSTEEYATITLINAETGYTWPS